MGKQKKLKELRRKEKHHEQHVAVRFGLADLYTALLLCFLVIVAFMNSFQNGFVSDDIAGILENPRIQTLTFDSPPAFVQPTLYYLAFLFGGLNPLPFRLINVFFHIGSVILVYLLVHKLHTRQLFAFVAAALFAVHPMVVEPLVWISGGTFIWYAFFFLLSWLLYIISHERPWTYWLSLVAYALSMASGVPAVVLFPVLALYEYAYGNLKKNWPRIVPFFLLAVVFAIIPIMNIAPRTQSFQTDHYQTESWNNPLTQLPVAISKYLELLLWPQVLSLYQSELRVTVVGFIFRAFITIGVIAGIIWLFLKNKKMFVWAMVFFIALSPTLTPLRITWIVAERYAYLSTAAVLVVAAYYLSKLMEDKDWKLLGYIIFVVALVGFTGRTMIRNLDWRDADTLYLSMGATAPSDPKTHNNIGDVYMRQGKYPDAIASFQRAIELNPRYADAMHNLANVYVRINQPEKALEYYQGALSINPRIWQSHQNVAVIYFNKKEYQKALDHMRQAIALNPNEDELYANLGIIYTEVGEVNEGKNSFQKALELDPENQKAKQYLGLQ